MAAAIGKTENREDESDVGDDLTLEPTGFGDPLEEAFDRIDMTHSASTRVSTTERRTHTSQQGDENGR